MRNRKPPTESQDPWEAADPPLAIALQRMNWYAKHRARSRVAYMVSEVLLLVAAAATTLAAALQASPWVTASLAAGSLVLTGLRKVFDWHEDWLAFSQAWAELGSAINDYRLLPEDRRDEKAQRRLVNKVNDVVTTETERWSSHRRSLTEARD